MTWLHAQNCTICDKPGWLIYGEIYEIKRVYPRKLHEKDRQVIVELEPHKCEREKEDERPLSNRNQKPSGSTS